MNFTVFLIVLGISYAYAQDVPKRFLKGPRETRDYDMCISAKHLRRLHEEIRREEIARLPEQPLKRRRLADDDDNGVVMPSNPENERAVRIIRPAAIDPDEVPARTQQPPVVHRPRAEIRPPQDEPSAAAPPTAQRRLF